MGIKFPPAIADLWHRIKGDETLQRVDRHEITGWRCGGCGGITVVDEMPTHECACGRVAWVRILLAHVRRANG